ncbi:arylamine N-acetyltransferase-like [Diadema setosum]|uniref:arylamine N-acetyltransferase-like n=1 Tax=Diadema setosum TaxID=31175 RepID=UPI003B3BCC40
MKDDPTGLLQEIVSSWHQHIPFQTITSIATPHEQRHVPMIDDIKRSIFTKVGGCCYENNVGCFMILRALGFNVVLVASDISLKNDHVILVVENLTSQGSRHMVDVGIGGYPTFLPVTLDFKKASPEYHDSYLRYKFVVDGDIIRRLHKADSDPAGAARFRDFVVDGWYPFTVIHHNAPVELSVFKESMNKIYTEVLPSPPFLTSPRSTAFPNGRFLAINDTTLLQENDEGKVIKTYLKSRDELLAAYARFFPQIPKEMVEAALNDVNVKLDFSKE